MFPVPFDFVPMQRTRSSFVSEIVVHLVFQMQNRHAYKKASKIRHLLHFNKSIAADVILWKPTQEKAIKNDLSYTLQRFLEKKQD